MIIKSPEEANSVENVEGNQSEQSEYNSKLQDIETNRMSNWADMSVVKKNLWDKLHHAKSSMQ